MRKLLPLILLLAATPLPKVDAQTSRAGAQFSVSEQESHFAAEPYKGASFSCSEGHDFKQVIADIPERPVSRDRCSDSVSIDEYYSGLGTRPPCTLASVRYEGPEDVYEVVLTEGNNVGFSLYPDSQSDLVLVLAGEQGRGGKVSTCVRNSVDLIGHGAGPEEIPNYKYPAGTYYLYVDSYRPGDCRGYELVVHGENPPEVHLSLTTQVRKDVGGGKLGAARGTSIAAGEAFIYELLVENESAFMARNVTLTIPKTGDGVEYGLLDDAQAVCEIENQSYVCRLDDIPGCGATPLEILVRIPPSHPEGRLDFTATVEGDYLQGEVSEPLMIDVVTQADVFVGRPTLSKPVAVPGEEIAYRFVVRNLGPSDIQGVTISSNHTDVLDCAEEDLTDAVDISAEGALVYEMKCKIDPFARGKLSYSVTAMAAVGVDPNLGNNTRTVKKELVPRADLVILKTDGETTLVPGRQVSYTIQVKNKGPSAAVGARVVDTFVEELTDCTWGRKASTGGDYLEQGSGNIDDELTLGPWDEWSYEATCKVKPGARGELINSARIYTPADVQALNPGDDSSSDVDELTPKADLALTKDDGVETAIPGESVTYTIRASNPKGPSDVFGARVVDEFPDELSCKWWAGATAPPEGAGEGDIDIEVDLAVGAVAVFTAECVVDPGARRLSNTAVVYVPEDVEELDQDELPHIWVDEDELTPRADLLLVKSGPERLAPGDLATYTIKVKNPAEGPSDVVDATVTDDLRPPLVRCAWSCKGRKGARCAEQGIGSIEDSVDLPVGSVAVYSLSCEVDTAASSDFKNVATVMAPAGVEKNEEDNTDDVITELAFRLNVTADDLGTVTSSPAGIDCNPSCSAIFDREKDVVLTAKPLAGNAFVEWGGDCTGGVEEGDRGMTTVHMDGNKECTATFGFELTVEEGGQGSGRVSVDPEGVELATSHWAFGEGTVVRLSATADDGSTFVGFSGEDDCADGVVTMDAMKSCTANFDLLGTVESCILPLDGLIAWWPFDEDAVSGPVAADIVAALDGSYVGSPVPQDGQVSLALAFDGVDDAVEVTRGDAPDLTAGDFSILFWIDLSDGSETATGQIVGRRPVDPEELTAGYELSLRDGQLVLGLGGEEFLSPFSLEADGVWHLVAVTFGEEAGGLWYRDGEGFAPAFQRTPQEDSSAELGSLHIGSLLDGVLDELVLFNRPLTAGEIAGIFEAKSLGMCKESVHVRGDTPICADTDAGWGRVTVCNHSTSYRSYDLSFSGLEAESCGGGIEGPVDFAPSEPSPWDVGGRTCKEVAVEIGRPEGMTAEGLQACYQVKVRERSTGSTFVREASLWDNRSWCASSPDRFPVDQSEGSPASWTFEVRNVQDDAASLRYELEPADKVVPPEAAEGATDFVDPNASISISVAAEDPDLRPFEHREIRLLDRESSSVLVSTGIHDAMASSAESLWLGGGRFRLQVERSDAEGKLNKARALRLTPETGYFYFSDEAQAELVVRWIDGCEVNHSWWVLYSALTDVELTLKVTDTVTDAVKTYSLAAGGPTSGMDVEAFPDVGFVALEPEEIDALMRSYFTIDPDTYENPAIEDRSLFFHAGRFQVEAVWEDFEGNAGDGYAVPLGDGIGYFSFSNRGSVDLVVQIVDGRPENGYWWVFRGALTPVEYTLTITDTKTDEVWQTTNTAGTFASGSDTQAFPEP